MSEKLSKKEATIRSMFDSSYKSDPKPVNLSEIEESVQYHIETILAKKPDTVLDVGMGAGGILLALQNNGVKTVYGVELSKAGVELAKKRFELYGDINNAHFFVGSFLEYQPPSVDVVTLHSVLHCHPDMKAMTNKILEASPDLIINTMPKRTWYNWIFLNVISIFTWLMTRFRVYSHSHQELEKILTNQGYQRTARKENFFSVTDVFERYD